MSGRSGRGFAAATLVGALALAALGAGCSGSSSKSSTPPSSTGSTSTTSKSGSGSGSKSSSSSSSSTSSTAATGSSSTTAGSSSATTATTALPADEAAVEHGITLIVEPSGKPSAFPIPTSFLRCVSSKLPLAARVLLRSINDDSEQPGSAVVYVVIAGAACDRGFLTTTLARSLTDDGSGVSGITAAEAACAAPRVVAALLRLDPTKVSSNSDDNAAVRAMLGSLDGCVPFQPVIDAALRSGDPSVTAAQLACVHTTMTMKTWAQVAAAGETAFNADLEHAVEACGVQQS